MTKTVNFNNYCQILKVIFSNNMWKIKRYANNFCRLLANAVLRIFSKEISEVFDFFQWGIQLISVAWVLVMVPFSIISAFAAYSIGNKSRYLKYCDCGCVEIGKLRFLDGYAPTSYAPTIGELWLKLQAV